MTVMVGNSAQFLRERSRSPDDAGVFEFFDRAAVENLYAAIRHAWQMIVALEPVSAGRRSAVIDILAIGVLRAASEGERDTARLARAAVWYLIARDGEAVTRPSHRS